MKFKDREEAAFLLLKKLERYKGKNPLVLGIPRGAITMARIIAEGLEGELGAILVHKIPSPDNEEFAIGSIGLSGNISRLPYIKMLGISEEYIESESKRQMEMLKERSRKYGLKNLHYQNKIVIIVDDGIATGATTLSAVYEVQSQKPSKVVVAAAVAARDSADKLREQVDEVIVLHEPEHFYAVSQFFDDFQQVSDEEVIAIFKGLHD